MVSLWPWKSEDKSPASFEKALSALATKIAKTQAQLSNLQQRSRRAKALWTLYSSFTYLLCLTILFLVVGWRNWTAPEYTAAAGSPLLIWLIRTAVTKYYTFRIDTTAQRLADQQGERAKTINRLKAATKYDSTQELLEKYGEEKPKPKPKKENTDTVPKTAKNKHKTPPGRTSMGPPPPTANIMRPDQIPSQPSTPRPLSQAPINNISSSPISPSRQVGQAEFAPNAFSTLPQYANTNEFDSGSHWYDRVLDLLMGEDETLPRNRMALICQNCRLVNGQAPPGTKTLAELGKWKCFGCGSMNGEEDEAVKVVQEMKERIEETRGQPIAPAENEATDLKAAVSEESGDSEDYSVEHEVVGESVETSASDSIEVKSNRGKLKGSRKKA